MQDRLNQIRKSTAPLHDALESLMYKTQIEHRQLTKTHYTHLLLTHYYSNEEISDYIDSISEFSAFHLDTSKMLSDDLKMLGVKTMSPHKYLKHDNLSLSFISGLLYVKLGSMLGTIALSKLLQTYEWFEHCNQQFFNHHTQVPQLWAKLKTLINTHNLNTHELITGAQAGFRLYEHYFLISKKEIYPVQSPV